MTTTSQTGGFTSAPFLLRRRSRFVQSAICRDLRVSRKVVRKVIRSQATEFRYERDVQPQPKIGPWRDRLDSLLLENDGKPARERLTLIRVFEELRGLGYEGGYDAVRRYARTWSTQRASETASAYVPLTFAPGEAYQFDWSHDIVVMDGVTTTVKVAHVRLCHSRMMLVRAYPRETQEMVFDAHERAFAFFRGACSRGIYDNMKTAVETIFIGKDRQYNRRFLQMCSHHLVEPVACTPAPRLEGRKEPPLHFGVDLRLRGAFGVFLDLLPQVLVTREDPGLVLPFVQVPAFGPELLEGVVEFDRGALRRDEVLDDLRLGEALDCAVGLGKRSHQEEARDLAGRVALHLLVDDLGVPALVPRAGDVVGYRSGQVVDVRHAVADVLDRQVEVLAADQVDVVEPPALDGPDHHRRQGHQAAGLAEPLVVLEEREDVLEARVERIGGDDLVDELLSGLRDGLGLHGVGDRVRERGRDSVDVLRVRRRRH